MAMITSIYDIFQSGNTTTVSIFEGGSVAEVGGVEMGHHLYTKVQQAIAYFLSPLWKDQHIEYDVMSMIENIGILQADVLSLPNTAIDGGSSTSELGTIFAAFWFWCLGSTIVTCKEQLSQQLFNKKDVSWSQFCHMVCNINFTNNFFSNFNI